MLCCRGVAIEINRNHIAASVASTIAVLHLGAAAGWLVSPRSDPSPSEYEIVSNTFSRSVAKNQILT